MKNFQKSNKKKKNKILKVLLISLFTILVIYNVVYLVTNVITSNRYIHIFEITLFTTKEDTLNNNININNLLIIKEQNERDLKVGDVVAYKQQNNLIIKTITKIYSENGKTYYTLKADKNYYNDIEDKTIGDIQGKVICNIPFIGFILSIFESKITSVIIILGLILLFLYKKELERRKRLRNKKKNAYYI